MAKKAATKKKPGRKPREAKPADGGETRNGEPFISATKKGRAGSKAAKAREYHAEHPKASVQEIADALSDTYNSVYQALKKTGKKTKKAPKAAKKTAKASGAGNGHASVIETAAAFVASCGGLKSAQQVLEQLSIIGSH